MSLTILEENYQITGSFGNAVLNRFLDTDIGEIRIFSRDEKKQDDMRHIRQKCLMWQKN